MNISELEAFLAVYEEGTYSRAATVLDVSQPAVSRRITLLESDLDCTLFERGRHGARATPAGEVFAPFARRALGELRAATDAVREVQTGESGRLTLAIAGTIPNTNLIHSLRNFRGQYPNVELVIATGTSDEVSDMVANGTAEAGLRYFAATDPALESIPVFHERVGVYAAQPTSLLDVSSPNAVALSACPWIMFPVGEGSSGEPLAVRAMEVLASADIRPKHIVRIDGLSAQKRLVAADFGVALMQQSAVVDELAAGTIQRVETDLVQTDFPIHLVVRKHRYTSVLRNRLIETLLAVGKRVEE